VSNGRSWSRNKVFVTYIPVEILGDTSTPWFASILITLNPLVCFCIGYSNLGMVGNGFVRICTDTKVFVLRYPTCG
jgi:hypothetical protein